MRNPFRRRPKESTGDERSPLRVAVKRGTYHLPKAGRYFLLVALGVLALGVHRRINLLMLLGDVLLVMTFLNLLAAGRSVRGLQARRRLGDWLFERTPCPVEVQVSNPDRHARLGLRIEEMGSDQTATWFIDWLPARGSVSWRRQVILPRRGRYTWGALWASSGYPFGLVERRRLLTLEESVLVLPRLGWLHRGRFLRYLRDLSVQPQRVHLRLKPQPHPAAQAEFHGLRSYRSGDSPRLIHWRTSARRGELMVREFEDEPSDNLLVVIDPTLPAESDYCGVPLREQFEEVVSLAGSLCWEWCRRRGDRLVSATATAKPTVLDGLTGPDHARRILESLAVLECGMGPVDPAVVASLQERRLPSALVVVVGLGRSSLADPLRRALGRRVYCLDGTRTDRFDFYEPPNGSSPSPFSRDPQGSAATIARFPAGRG
jgi:uncharacterized protein (DUF58 family)